MGRITVDEREKGNLNRKNSKFAEVALIKSGVWIVAEIASTNNFWKRK
jgi:hypothetical protein